jgi:hypothetical protein
MMNIKRLDKKTNAEIYRRTGQAPLVEQVQQRQLRFIGHSLRRDSSEPINMYALYTPKPSHGKSKQGRPKLSYTGYIARLINNDPLPTADEIRKYAADREEWTKIVVACKPSLFAAD